DRGAVSPNHAMAKGQSGQGRGYDRDGAWLIGGGQGEGWTDAPMTVIPQAIHDLFAARGWAPFEFQVRAWEAYLAGQSGLIHAPTGVGKTWAAWLGPVIEACDQGTHAGERAAEWRRSKKRDTAETLRVLWVTPLRALANDTAQSLLDPVID